MWMIRSPLLNRICRIFVICLEQFSSDDQVQLLNGSRVKVSILDILLHRDGHDIITTVYRKVTNNDVYLN